MGDIENLLKSVKLLAYEVLNEPRGRPRKKKVGRQLSDKVVMQTAIMLLLGDVKGWSIRVLHKKLTEYHNPDRRNLCGVAYSEIPARSSLDYRSRHKKVKVFQDRLYS